MPSERLEWVGGGPCQKWPMLQQYEDSPREIGSRSSRHLRRTICVEFLKEMGSGSHDGSTRYQAVFRIAREVRTFRPPPQAPSALVEPTKPLKVSKMNNSLL